MTICRHCKKDRHIKARQICKACYEKPHIRARYAKSPPPGRGVDRGGPRCRHCKVKPISRPRKLCYGCHNDTAIRELYAVDPQYGRKNDQNVVTMPVLTTYPDPGRRVRCECGRDWNGECSSCERKERERVLVVAC